ncbi:MAG: Uma2 family endonuclease [Thermomicrobiales bacterium]|nr:Uma2 family endonuclease [Thermomicrobiales bacterium]
MTHLITAAELLDMGSDARHELIEGVLTEVSPSSIRPGVIAANLVIAIGSFVQSRELGRLSTAEGGFILSRNPDTVVAPDIGFFRTDRYLGELPERGFFPLPPDLAIEIISPTDEPADIRRKQAAYDNARVPQVWWVDPGARTVTICRPGREPEVLDESMTLEGGDELPEFSMPVARVFAL